VPPRVCTRTELVEQLREHVLNNFVKVRSVSVLLLLTSCC
jgi:hypothetical protein